MSPRCVPRSGIIGERLPIRLYLTAGMLASGLCTCLFGLGYVYNIHSLSFYVVVQVGLFAPLPCGDGTRRPYPGPAFCFQVVNGLVQTTGWPSVVTCIGNWFGKGR